MSAVRGDSRRPIGDFGPDLPVEPAPDASAAAPAAREAVPAASSGSAGPRSLGDLRAATLRAHFDDAFAEASGGTGRATGSRSRPPHPSPLPGGRESAAAPGVLASVQAGGAIRRGSEGDSVRALQRALAGAGIEVAETGTFDRATEAAVKRFQRERRLDADGVVGPVTGRALDLSAGIPRTGNAFIDRIAPGAVAGQREHGVPASVAIAQAILESGWGKSGLAANNHNLFGIKGKGPAGTVVLNTKEYRAGAERMERHGFRAYHSDDESLVDHARLLSTSRYYRTAMSHRDDSERFAHDLTGVYCPNPEYGKRLVQIMRQYDLDRFDGL